MDFSSTPAYNLDASHWQQQQNHQIIGSSNTNTFLPPPLPQPHGGSTGIGSIRPRSMSEHPRLASIIRLPETSIKCPRCESTYTKFCYYNNYNLSQPRHFCKTCRRYWTRGGALRSIPVGGGCRRNKRTSKSSTSKSPASTYRQTTGGSASILGLRPPQFASLPLMTDHSFTSEMNYSAQLVRTSDQIMNFNSLRDVTLQQFPFLDGNLDPLPIGNYQFQGIGELGFEKLEDGEKADQLNLSMQGNDEWNNIFPSNSNTDWTDLSNFDPSSSSSNFDIWITKSLNL